MKLLIEDLCKTRKLEGLKYTYWDECFTSKVGSFNLRKLFNLGKYEYSDLCIAQHVIIY